MGLVTLPVKYLPYIMIGMDLLTGGPYAAAQGIAGAIVGHFWTAGVLVDDLEVEYNYHVFLSPYCDNMYRDFIDLVSKSNIALFLLKLQSTME